MGDKSSKQCKSCTLSSIICNWNWLFDLPILSKMVIGKNSFYKTTRVVIESMMKDNGFLL